MNKHDLVVIGAGPGGYVAAIRGAQLGLDVACIDANKALGGTCLRVGCIPSKALLESSERYIEAQSHLSDHGIQVDNVRVDLAAMLKRKDKIVQTLTKGVESLLKKNKVTRYEGHGRFAGPGAIEINGKTSEKIEAKHIIIATGSTPAALRGVTFDKDRIGTSTEALSYDQVPKHLVVIGAGYIGLEMGSVWLRLGAKVTVLEYLDRILPGMDAEMAGQAKKLFEKQGMTFQLGSKVTGAKSKKDKCTVECEGRAPIECDRVLVAVGRVPNTEKLGLDQIGIEPDDKGRIPVDEHYTTSVENVYAIGDVIAGPMLAHKASEEAVACVENIVNGTGHVDYNAIPAVVYTHPEIASVGRTEEQLKEDGVEYKKGSFLFRANPRARCIDDVDGFVKVLADAATDRVLGVHIIGPSAGDLIAEAAVAMTFQASSEDLALACHAHPTLAEAIKEAALDVHDRVIHS